MTCDYIKQEIPEAISEEGGARIQIVNKNTVPLATSVKEAKEGLYVIGDEQLIRGEFQGLFKSMAAGVARDGHSRQIGDFLTVYAQPEGQVDLETGWDPMVNSFRLKARLLNEMVLDITDWTFRDVTPGRAPFKLNSVSTGELSGLVEIGNAVHINGTNLPSVSEATVEWYVEGTTKRGTVAAAKLTGDCDRVDIAADALSELASTTYDGKTIVFTIRGNFANAKISAVLKYVATTLTSATTEGDPTGSVRGNKTVTFVGTGLRAPATGEQFFLDLPEGKGQVNPINFVVAADKCSMTAHLPSFPAEFVTGEGTMVWLESGGSTLACCTVNVLS